jgi:hypothetical protein
MKSNLWTTTPVSDDTVAALKHLARHEVCVAGKLER